MRTGTAIGFRASHELFSNFLYLPVSGNVFYSPYINAMIGKHSLWNDSKLKSQSVADSWFKVNIRFKVMNSKSVRLILDYCNADTMHSNWLFFNRERGYFIVVFYAALDHIVSIRLYFCRCLSIFLQLSAKSYRVWNVYTVCICFSASDST